jgi:uncharacterized protein YqgC (DUF456 family)
MMHWIYYLLLLVCMAAGLWINILSLPGLWLMIAAAGIYAWLTDGNDVGWVGLLVLVVIALLAELMEFIAGGAVAKKAGGSKRAFIGAIVGGFLGAIFFTFPLGPIGTIFGICLGTFIGAVGVEWLVERRAGHALRVGYGAAKGRLVGIAIKLLFGVVIFLMAAILAWPSEPAPAVAPALPPTTMPATQPTTME